MSDLARAKSLRGYSSRPFGAQASSSLSIVPVPPPVAYSSSGVGIVAPRAESRCALGFVGKSVVCGALFAVALVIGLGVSLGLRGSASSSGVVSTATPLSSAATVVAFNTTINGVSLEELRTSPCAFDLACFNSFMRSLSASFSSDAAFAGFSVRVVATGLLDGATGAGVPIALDAPINNLGQRRLSGPLRERPDGGRALAPRSLVLSTKIVVSSKTPAAPPPSLANVTAAANAVIGSAGTTAALNNALAPVDAAVNRIAGSSTVTLPATVVAVVDGAPTTSASGSASASLSGTPTASISASVSSSTSRTATTSASASASATLTASTSATASASATASKSISPSASLTSSSSSSASSSPSLSSSATQTSSITASVEPTSSISPSAAATQTTSGSTSQTSSITSSVAPTISSSPSVSATQTTSGTASASITATSTASASSSETPSLSPSTAATITSSASSAETPSLSPSTAATITASASSAATQTPTSSTTATTTTSASIAETSSPTSSTAATITSSASIAETPSPTSSTAATITSSASSAETPSPTSSTTATTTSSASIAETPTLSPSTTPSVDATPSLAASPSVEATPTASVSVTTSVLATVTPSPSTTPSVAETPSLTGSPTSSASLTPTSTPSLLSTASSSPSGSITGTKTGSGTVSPSTTPAVTATSSITASPTGSPVPPSPSGSPSSSASSSSAATGTPSASGSPSLAASSSPAETGTSSASGTPSLAASSTSSPSATPSPVAAGASSPTPSISPAPGACTIYVTDKQLNAQSDILESINAGQIPFTVMPAAQLAGYWYELSAIAADAQGNIYVADPLPTKGADNYPNNSRVAGQIVNGSPFLPAIFKLTRNSVVDSPYGSSEVFLQDWTTSALETTSVSSSGCKKTTAGSTTDCIGNVGRLKANGEAPGPFRMNPKHDEIDYAGIVGIALAKSDPNVLLYAVRSTIAPRSVTPEVFIVPTPASLNQAISTMTVPGPGGRGWGAPVAIAVATNVAYSGSDAVFIADKDNGVIYWYNDDAAANSNGNYAPAISGDGTNNFGGTWSTGPLSGQSLGKPISLAVLPVYDMQPRMYIGLTTRGVVYYSKGSYMQPLGAGGASGNGGCPFAAPVANNLITAMAIDPFGNIYMTGSPPSSSAEAHVCRSPNATTPYIFLGGDILVSNALEDPTGIAVSCPA